MRVLVAMSGGVDSSVAAALMTAEGHEVIGVTLKLWEGPGGAAPTAGCCTLSDAEDARRVAAQLDIPYYVLDYTDAFRVGVVDRFTADYAAGRTPNPCVECNRVVKFDLLLDQAFQLGCDLLVTGHYARVGHVHGEYQLLQAVDQAKDQSYVLYMLGQAELARVRFPLGDMRKSRTRELAVELDLRTAAKADSQEVCFVGAGGYRTFLRVHAPEGVVPGPVLDLNGRVLGRHEGFTDFTVGQRRGLGVAFGEPRYVVEVRPATAAVVVGGAADLLVSGCMVTSPSWVSSPPRAGHRLEVRLRYRSESVAATVEPVPVLVGGGGSSPAAGGDWMVWFDEPTAAVAPGQAAVFYQGQRVLGGGSIVESFR